MECSAAWESLPAWGTSARASFWVALEQPGPWGREALTQSHLDPELGARLAAATSAAGGRVLLIRAPGPHVDRAQSRHVFVAGGLASGAWLLEGTVQEPEQVAALPWALLAGADPAPVCERAPWLRPATRPLLLVCANSRRDVCCATRGRPVALAADAARPGQVWECSHTGGHRFAPTGVLLPVGQSLARLTPGLAVEALDAGAAGRLAAGLLGERHDRGRSHLGPAAAAAESWVRARLGEIDPAALFVPEADAAEPGLITVRHADGRAWVVEATRWSGPSLPESCGKAPVPALTWRLALRTGEL